MGVRYRGEPEFVIEGNPSGIRGRIAAIAVLKQDVVYRRYGNFFFRM